MQTIFKLIFLLGLIIEETIRAPHRKRNRRERREGRMTASQIDVVEVVTMTVAAVGYLLLPVIYIFWGWPSAFDYTLPNWAGIIGAALVALSVWVLWRAHRDLGKNWSPTLEVVKGQQLVTDGVYGIVRHPIYAAFWLLVLAQPLLLHNWIAGFAGIVGFLPVYLTRVPREEQMMVEQFGDAYRAYKQRVGGVIPRF